MYPEQQSQTKKRKAKNQEVELPKQKKFNSAGHKIRRSHIKSC